PADRSRQTRQGRTGRNERQGQGFGPAKCGRKDYPGDTRNAGTGLECEICGAPLPAGSICCRVKELPMSVSDVIVVGAGPAGSALACLLAARGINTLLIEEKRMPREKLCGAFITPECFPTLARLGAMDQVLGAGAHTISELRLVAPSGRGVTASISAISRGERALSLSRSRLDSILFDGAKRAGAVCLEG